MASSVLHTQDIYNTIVICMTRFRKNMFFVQFFLLLFCSKYKICKLSHVMCTQRRTQRNVDISFIDNNTSTRNENPVCNIHNATYRLCGFAVISNGFIQKKKERKEKNQLLLLYQMQTLFSIRLYFEKVKEQLGPKGTHQATTKIEMHNLQETKRKM